MSCTSAQEYDSGLCYPACPEGRAGPAAARSAGREDCPPKEPYRTAGSAIRPVPRGGLDRQRPALLGGRTARPRNRTGQCLQCYKDKAERDGILSSAVVIGVRGQARFTYHELRLNHRLAMAASPFARLTIGTVAIALTMGAGGRLLCCPSERGAGCAAAELRRGRRRGGPRRRRAPPRRPAVRGSVAERR
jgi:hypothetical protein